MKRVDRVVRRIADKRKNIASDMPQDLRRSDAVFSNLHVTAKRAKLPEAVDTNLDLQKLEKVSRLSRTKRAKRRLEVLTRLAWSRVNKSSKFGQIRRLFGRQGEHAGIMIIKPELFGRANEIRHFLNSLGFEVMLTKNVLFDKKMICDIFGDEFRKSYNFAVEGAHMRINPSKVLVFKLLPRKEMYKRSDLLQRLKSEDQEKYREMLLKLNGMSIQEVFSTLIKGRYYGPASGSLRKEVVHPFLNRIGSEAGGELAQKLDVFGYVKGKKFQGIPDWANNKLLWFTGVHAPSEPKELFVAANTLLSDRDLEKLDRGLQT
ncbi:MAG: hypothetical protein HOE11_05190 [Candidatus Diapherotrites archaeon]|jgi:hypothetical protein|nr:hypothetical protein [Candidatus Diapherotrites archaeon]MBT4596576.1 hypothetical protein [Candidatus Diapherotrites archaeon]